jgi:lipoyl-dependent peroxiredoxin
VDTIKPLHTATATAVGGRNGHSEMSDGIVKADLSVPKEMGGPGRPNTATPEHLFAAGYAACFGGSLDYVAKQNKRDAPGSRSPVRSRLAHAKTGASASP